jgi:methyl-accepting chemotaxis protein
VTMAQAARQIANGDLTNQLSVRLSQDEIGVLANAFKEMQAKMAEVVRDVKASAQDVAQRSREMNAVANQMSSGAAEQAAATEEVSASMEEMAANIRQTAENAKLTESMAVKSADDARAGKQSVSEIIHAMEVIAERISVIQEIASQTNILSLNATIEAAKAQEYGKGFTVVASSVRELAHQSRTAADEIRVLVHSCVELSAQAGDVLKRLVPNSEKTAELVQEICASSQEQSAGVEHVNQAVQQLDTVTQHNASTSEELAATTEVMTRQAGVLQQAMAFFTINEAPSFTPAKEEELLQLLQGVEKEQLVAFLRKSALFTNQPQSSAAIAESSPLDSKLPQTPRADHAPAVPRATRSGVADERDPELEHH